MVRTCSVDNRFPIYGLDSPYLPRYILPGGRDMQGQTGERWRRLCEQAAEEQDPDELLKLVNEITQLLDEKTKRLKQREQNGGSVPVK